MIRPDLKAAFAEIERGLDEPLASENPEDPFSSLDEVVFFRAGVAWALGVLRGHMPLAEVRGELPPEQARTPRSEFRRQIQENAAKPAP